MQELFLIAVTLLAIAAVAFQLSVRGLLREHPAVAVAAAGVVPGAFGAVLVLAPRVDLIPDALEPALWVMALSVLVVVALASLIARRAEP
ncbi:MAG TPA: hypothetical protein VGK63_03560 [Candidatus Limnocylindrales bacterium]